jgi:hypothetical protein
VAGFATWPANTEVTITFKVDAFGAVGLPSINGELFQEVNWEDRVAYDEFGTRTVEVPWVPGCQPLTWTTESALYVGRAGAASTSEDFQGSIAELSIDYDHVPAPAPVPPPPWEATSNPTGGATGISWKPASTTPSVG